MKFPDLQSKNCVIIRGVIAKYFLASARSLSPRSRRKIRAEIARARNLRASKENCGFRARNILRVRASKISCVSRAQRALAQCARGTRVRVIVPLVIPDNGFHFQNFLGG